MNSVKRRGGGRPNRGGGKHSRGHHQNSNSHGGGGGGGGGDGGSRKGDAAFNLDEDVSVNVKSVASDTTAEAESESKFKVEMQKLHMSDENQELVKAALIDIRGDLKLRAENSYRDWGRRLDHGYWLKDNHLLVRGGVDYSQPSTNDDSPSQETDTNNFGLQKLLGIGFHKSRCLSALSRTDGDVGAALELIMSESFDVHCSVGDNHHDASPGEIVSSDFVEEERTNNSVHIDQELLDQRNDEKMALESIYETQLTEKIVGKVWELRLTLEHLLNYLPKEKEKPTKKGEKENKNICPYFLAGHCRFGRRCYKVCVSLNILLYYFSFILETY